jgi:hypothetical protein
MPKLSKDSAQNVQDAGPAVDRSGDLDDTTVSFVTIRQSHSRSLHHAAVAAGWALLAH